MVIAGNDHFMNVPAEATAFLGAVAAFVVLLLVFFLYLNKKWCFYGVGGFPCCDDQLGVAARAARSKHLGRAYSYEPESSSDSEEEVLRRLQQSGSLSFSCASQLREPTPPPRRQTHRSESREPLASPCGKPSRSSGGGSSSQPGCSSQQQDLISLAEKGKVGSSSASASSSCSSSTADDDHQHHNHHSHNHNHHRHHRHSGGGGGGGGEGKALRHRGADAGYRLLCSVDALAETSAPAAPTTTAAAAAAAARAQNAAVAAAAAAAGSGAGAPGGIQHMGNAHTLLHSPQQHPPPALPPPPQSAHPLVALSPSTSQLQQQQQQQQQRQQHQQQQQQQHVISNQDCVVVLPLQEPLFDVSDLRSDDDDAGGNGGGGVRGGGGGGAGGVEADADADADAALVSRCGHLEVAFAYDAPIRTMTVRVLQARDVPARDRGGAAHAQVRLLLLPGKKQKHKTKIRSGEAPQFLESFLLHRVNPEDVNSMGVRFRLYGCERMRRERMIGEAVVSFASLNLELETTMWLALEPRANLTSSSVSDLRSLARSDSTGSTQSMQHGGVPELLVGLAYNGTTGRLSVEVVKGSHFRNLAMTRAPDTYVKLCLVSSSGQEMARAKTSVRRGQPNPLFKETFMFQVALFQLPDVTLMVSVYNKRSMKRKEMIGWFSLGLNSSGEEELAHWNDMRDVRGEQISRWHVLVES